jgi:carbamoyl-phosphate synthase/aspartate carbamoyltransferase/dihydroorotase
VEEKKGLNAPPGFPGLETMLPLMLTAVDQGRLTIDDLVQKMHHNPKRIFKLPEQPNTYIEVNLDEEWVIPDAPFFSKAMWTPFAGKTVVGKLKRVVLRGELAYVDGMVLAEPGFGQDVRTWKEKAISIMIPSEDGSPRKRTTSITNSLFSAPMASPGRSRLPAAAALSPMPPPLPLLVQHAADKCQHSLVNKNILKVNMFNKDMLYTIFNVAERFRSDVKTGKILDDILRGKVMASIFYEVSTRTMCSFSSAMQRLGGKVIYMDEESSSTKKGETVEDAVQVMGGYADVVVLRHPMPGAVARAATNCKKPVINAGDGVGEHPTQALLDVFTIRSEIGTVKNRKCTSSISNLIQ